tara:strand:- start:3145 stop:3669 length:525 start_codon:yes stop_codon:yes gene_type:complete
MKKLKDLLIEVFEDEQPKINKKEVIEGVAQYGIIGKGLYASSNILDVAEQLVKIAESAHSHILSETDEWFDKVSVSRNMKSLKSTVQEFKKTAKEYNTLGQRLQDLYENVGFTLNKYYDINEETGDKEEYQAFFRKTAEEFGVDPEKIDELPDDKKKEFYDAIDSGWKADKETD